MVCHGSGYCAASSIRCATFTIYNTGGAYFGFGSYQSCIALHNDDDGAEYDGASKKLMMDAADEVPAGVACIALLLVIVLPKADEAAIVSSMAVRVCCFQPRLGEGMAASIAEAFFSRWERV